jgi:hypothetical protein
MAAMVLLRQSQVRLLQGLVVVVLVQKALLLERVRLAVEMERLAHPAMAVTLLQTLEAVAVVLVGVGLIPPRAVMAVLA